MLDSYIKTIIDPTLDIFGEKLVEAGFTANMMTSIGFTFGIIATIAIIFDQYNIAAVFIACNRLADGLDGAIARNIKLTDFGGFLDIVCDFIIYSGIVFAFGLTNPSNLLYASFLLFSFVGATSSFLAYAIIASKQNITTQKRGEKSFYYLGGICEGTETAAVLILFCLIPQHFSSLCVGFGTLCWITTAGRIYNAWNDFGKTSESIISAEDSYTKQAEEIKPQDQ